MVEIFSFDGDSSWNYLMMSLLIVCFFCFSFLSSIFCGLFSSFPAAEKYSSEIISTKKTRLFLNKTYTFLTFSMGSVFGNAIGKRGGKRTSSIISCFRFSCFICSALSCGFGAHPSVCSNRVSSSIFSLSFGGL